MAMQVFTVGQVLAAADVNEYLVNTKFAIKGTDTGRPSTTTLAADPDLTLPVDANKSYIVEMFMNLNGSASGNFKYNLGAPAGATLNGFASGQSGLTFAFAGTYDSSGSFPPSAVYNMTLTGVAPAIVNLRLSGILVVASTAGSLTLQWAQNASNATPTIVQKGSSMLLRRVA